MELETQNQSLQTVFNGQYLILESILENINSTLRRK